MISLCLRLLIVAVVSDLTISSVVAQEAVETATPGSSSEQSPAPKEKDKNPDQSKPTKSLEETMRPEEFKAAGLDKLNEDELQHLDAYLQGYRQAAKKKANDEAQAKASEEIKKAKQEVKTSADDTGMGGRSRMDALVSRVDGNIEGIKGHTMIRLEDGTVWKQVNVDDHYKASITDHPAAVVLHTTFGYKMRIEGMPEFYVDPVNMPGH
ncbi:MAG TPA: hypothetical protein VKS98_09015 [Chthoniobacterales bacterium]|nr:hypothetical protein [Chthoniobacterales bacterium]